MSPEYLAVVDAIRAYLATVPFGVTKGGATYLDFAAYRRGKRR